MEAFNSLIPGFSFLERSQGQLVVGVPKSTICDRRWAVFIDRPSHRGLVSERTPAIPKAGNVGIGHALKKSGLLLSKRL
jgi:hypothetical protein